MRNLFLCCFFLAGCTTSFKREGYSISSYQADPQQCKVAIRYQAKPEEKAGKLLGTISASEPGLGTTCDHEYVVLQFLKDACEIKADLINIIEEKFPDHISTCYRAKAELIAVNSKRLLRTDARYYPDKIRKNTKKLGQIFTEQFKAQWNNE
ncbi:MAG: hypothetical protein AB7F59_04375 [Bdellovibrionales bacterium]